MSSFCKAQVIISQELFDDGNGASSGIMSGGEPWLSTSFGNCDATPGNWSIAGGQFNINDIEGFGCCNCDGSATPPLNCGNLQNEVIFGPINISNYWGFSIEIDVTTSGNLECLDLTNQPCQPNPTSACSQDGDQLAFYYSVDGGPYQLFSYFCGETHCIDESIFCGISGNSLSIRMVGGTQSTDEFYNIDNLILRGNQNFVITKSPNLNCEFEEVTFSINPLVGDMWDWSGPAGSSSSSTWIIPSINLSDGGIYSVVVTDDNGCTSEETTNLVVRPTEVPLFDPFEDLCILDDTVVQFPTTSLNFLNGTWTPPNMSPVNEQPGTFTATFNPDPNSCVEPVTISFEIKRAEPYVIEGEFKNCEAGDPIPLPIEFPGVRGQWSGPVINDDNELLGNPVGQHQIVFTPDAPLCAEPTTVTATIDASPTGQIFPPFSPICPGVCNKVFLSASGGKGPPYIFYFNWNFGPVGSVLPAYDSIILDNNLFSFDICVDPEWGTAPKFFPEENRVITPYAGGQFNFVLTLIGVSDFNCRRDVTQSVSFDIARQPYIEDATLEGCGDASGIAFFDLDEATDLMLGNFPSGLIFFYSDPELTNRVFSPYQSGNGVLYATRVAEVCPSDTAVLTLLVVPTLNVENLSLTCNNGTEVCNFCDETSNGMDVKLSFNLPDDGRMYEVEIVVDGSTGGNSITKLYKGPLVEERITIYGPTTFYLNYIEVAGFCPDFTDLGNSVFVDYNERPKFTPIPNLKGCKKVKLPNIVSNIETEYQGFYTMPGGMGDRYKPGDILTTSQVLYVFTGVPQCFREQAFEVKIIDEVKLFDLRDTTFCDSLVLPAINGINFNPLTTGFQSVINGKDSLILPGFTIGQSFVFTLNDTSANGCIDTLPLVTFTKIVAPMPPLQDSTYTLCIGETPPVFNPSGNNIQWYDINNIPLAQAPIITTDVKGNQLFYVTQSLNSCESESATLRIEVKDCNCTTPVAVTNIVANQNEYCIGDTAKLTYRLTGTPSLFTISASPTNAGSILAYTDSTATILIQSSGQLEITCEAGDPDGAGPCESDIEKISLLVNGAPAAPITRDTIYCKDDVAIPLIAAGQNLQWYDFLFNPLPNAPTPSTTDVGNSVYYVSQTEKNCISSFAAINVRINDCGCQTPAIIQSLSITDDQICLLENITISAVISGGATSGVWTVLPVNGGVFANANALNTTFTASSEGNYVLQFTTNDPDGANTACSVTSDLIPLSILEIPQQPTGTTSFNYCEDEVALPLTANAGSPLIWYNVNGVEISPNPIPNTSSAGTTSYFVSANNGRCESAKTEIIVTVTGSPLLPTAQNVAYCQNDIATPLTANSANQLIWYDAAGNVIASNPTPNTNNVGSVSYFVSSKNGNCESGKREIIVTINSNPLIPTSQNVTYCQGDVAVPLTATSTNTLTWYDANGNLLAGVPTPNTNAVGATSYFVSSTNGNCESDKREIVVTITSNPLAPTAQDVSYCKDETAVPLTATSTNNLIWYNASGTTLSGVPTPNTNAVGTVSYFVSAKNGNCESVREEIVVTIKAIPNAPQTQSVTYCVGDAVVPLTATGNNLQWYTSQSGNPSGNAPTPSSTNAGTTTYFVTSLVNGCESEFAAIDVIIEECGCLTPATLQISSGAEFCEGETIQLTANLGGSASSITWSSNGSGSFSSNSNLITIYTPSAADVSNGNIIISGLTNDPDGLGLCNAAVDVMDIKINPTPNNPQVSDRQYCVNDSIIEIADLVLNGTNLEFYKTQSSTAPLTVSPKFNINNTADTTFYVTQTVNGCESGKSAIKVSVKDVLQSNANYITCNNDFEVTIGNQVFNAANPTGSVKLTSVQGCDSIVVVDIKIEKLTLTESTENALCEEGNGVLTLNANTLSPPYLITIGNLYNQSVNSLPVDIILPAGDHTAVITDAEGCTDEVESTIEFTNIPAPVITVITQGSQSQINVTSTLPLSNIEWSPSEFLSCDDCLNPIVRQSGTYTITYSYDENCDGIGSVYVEKIIVKDIYFPNVLNLNSPTNNTFYGTSSQDYIVTGVSMQIFDRWGNKVFQNNNYTLNDPSAGWDGNVSSSPVMPGVYVYAVRVLDGDVEQVYLGDVTVVR